MAKKSENLCPVPNGKLVVIGGKENKGEAAPENKEAPSDYVPLEVLETLKSLIKKKSPVLEVITTSTNEPADSFNEYQEIFHKIGIERIGHIHHQKRQEVLDDWMEDRLSKADIFFFTGGDQLKLTSMYGGTRFLTFLKQRYIADDIVIAGTSAGAMALSTPMIYAGNEEVQELGGEIKITTGLEFLKDVCIDTHFVHRGRFIRMAQVVVTNPTCIGLGIEEDTAVIVTNGVNAEVVGSGCVIVIEGFDIAESNLDEFTSKKPVSLRNLRVHILTKGNEYLIPQVNPPHL